MLEQEALALRAEIQHRKENEKALLEAFDEKRKTEENLRKTESQLRGILQNAAEGIHWVDLNGRILWANHAELELLGYSAEEYIEHDAREFHADPAVISDILQRLSVGETLRNYPADLLCKDGSIRHVLINSNIIRQNDDIVHTQCFTRDVTVSSKHKGLKLSLARLSNLRRTLSSAKRWMASSRAGIREPKQFLGTPPKK
jgi:PAS domain S-box-containing protein